VVYSGTHFTTLENEDNLIIMTLLVHPKQGVTGYSNRTYIHEVMTYLTNDLHKGSVVFAVVSM